MFPQFEPQQWLGLIGVTVVGIAAAAVAVLWLRRKLRKDFNKNK